MSKPAIFVTNVAAARARTPGVAGPNGRNVWSIMSRPDIAKGEGGHGRCCGLQGHVRAQPGRGR